MTGLNILTVMQGEDYTLDHELPDDAVKGASLVAEALLACTQSPAHTDTAASVQTASLPRTAPPGDIPVSKLCTLSTCQCLCENSTKNISVLLSWHPF